MENVLFLIHQEDCEKLRKARDEQAAGRGKTGLRGRMSVKIAADGKVEIVDDDREKEIAEQKQKVKEMDEAQNCIRMPDHAGQHGKELDAEFSV